MAEFNYDLRHKKIAMPCVRIRSGKALGSGTVIYSQGGSTYVLTNHHVVADSISIDTKWSGLLKREKKVDVFEAVEVHLFDYAWESRAIGGTSVLADIMAYDKEEDLALLKLRSGNTLERTADLYPRDAEKDLRIGMKVIAIGAGLGNAPVQTEGLLSQFGQEIDRREYWLNSAPTIFGNSGGSLFLKDTYQLIGVPARISVNFIGWSADAVTHLSYAIPITRIYDFLEDQRFRFIYDSEYTEAGEAELRKDIQEQEELKIVRSERN